MAMFVFWYEQEVQKGGHLQYLENRGAGEAREAISSLRHLGARCHADVLSRAVARYSCKTRPEIHSVNQYVETALEGEFDDLDRSFHGCQPCLVKALENYLAQIQSEFVVIEE
jgi:hypothetical protein